MLKNLAFCGRLPPSCGENMTTQVEHRGLLIRHHPPGSHLRGDVEKLFYMSTSRQRMRIVVFGISISSWSAFRVLMARCIHPCRGEQGQCIPVGRPYLCHTDYPSLQITTNRAKHTAKFGSFIRCLPHVQEGLANALAKDNRFRANIGASVQLIALGKTSVNSSV
jgi:hypothetical protein